MSYYIRPRQDFTLSTFSKIMKALFDKDVVAAYTLVIDPDTERCETRICIDSNITYEEAVNIICNKTDCTLDNFKLKKVEE